MPEGEKMDKVKIFEEIEALLYQKAKDANVSDLERYFIPEAILKRQNYYCRLASSLQNGTSSGMDKSIRFNGENRATIESVLYDFDHIKVLKYGDETALYNAFLQKIPDNGKISRDKRASNQNLTEEEKKTILARKTNWQKYAKGLFEGAKLLKEKSSLIDELIKHNNSNSFDKKELSNLLNNIKIFGLGMALRCDWLKECGCTWLIKPDVHIKTVYHAMVEKEKGTTIDYSKIKDWDVIEYYFKWAQELKQHGKNVTAYQLDKMIWLICTGEFYLDKNESIGRNTIITKIANS